MSLLKKSKYNKIRAVLRVNSDDPCVFCNRTTDDELIYGNFYTLHDISCHYFCVLLSSCAVQCGDDDEGLFGFLYSNIVEEVERGKKNKCSYCNKYGATLGCSLVKCRKQFHLPCGRERNAISIFSGTFKSFCEKHAPKPAFPSSIMTLARVRRKNEAMNIYEDNIICVICCEVVQGYPSPRSFWPPCCAKDVWFHRTCIQRMALSSGVHYLKCPLCNDKDMFYESVLGQGFYIPDRDAAWELEQNAYNDMYERPVKCDADICKCDNGRDYDSESGLWDIKLCLLCGSVGSHVGCQNDPESNRFICDSCAQVPIPDLDEFEKALESIRLQDNVVTSRERVGPPMPTRMSLRGTKLNSNIERTSLQTDNSVAETEIDYLNELDSVTKYFKIEVEKDVNEMSEGDVIKFINKLKQRSEKPMPMRFKKIIKGGIAELEKLILKKRKENKCRVIEIMDTSEPEVNTREDDIIVIEDDPVELKECKNNVKKMVVDIKKYSSLEISEADESVKIEVISLDETDDEAVSDKSDSKFSTGDREYLDNNNKVTDIESFKKSYLREIYKNKINYDERDRSNEFENGTSPDDGNENSKFKNRKRANKKSKKRKREYKIKLKKLKGRDVSSEILKETVLNSPKNIIICGTYGKGPKSDTFKQTTLFNYFNSMRIVRSTI